MDLALFSLEKSKKCNELIYFPLNPLLKIAIHVKCIIERRLEETF